MSVNRAENYGDVKNPEWFREEAAKKDTQIAANYEIIADLARVQIESNEILRALAEREELLSERQSELREDIDHLKIEMQQIKRNRTVRVENEMSSKISSVIAGLLIVGLIATGIVVGVIYIV